MASRPTSKKRNTKAKVKARYSKAREDAQLHGVIETTPEGAVKDERVDPATQGSQPLPGLIASAIRKGWSTPEEKKPRLVDEMVGLIEAEETDPHVKVSAFRVLQQGDKDQWERDNPDLAGKTKGSVKVGVEVNQQVSLLQLARESLAKPDPLEEAKRKALEDKKEVPSE